MNDKKTGRPLRSAEYFVPHKCKRCVLALLFQLQQNRFQKRRCLGMKQQPPVLAPEKEPVGVAGVKLVAPIRFAGSQPVAKHFCYVSGRHFHTGDAGAVGGVICPEFKMVTVTALMVHPRGAVSVGGPLGVVGTAIPLKIFGSGEKFHRRILGKIMGQSLPVQPQAKAILPNQLPVMMNSF